MSSPRFAGEKPKQRSENFLFLMGIKLDRNVCNVLSREQNYVRRAEVDFVLPVIVLPFDLYSALFSVVWSSENSDVRFDHDAEDVTKEPSTCKLTGATFRVTHKLMRSQHM